MTDFGSGQRDERGAGRRLRRWGRSREVVVDRDAQEEGRSEQDQSDVAIPAHIAAYFILVKSQSFASVQVLFDVPTAANGLHDERQGRVRWSPDPARAVWPNRKAAALWCPGFD